MKSGLLCREKKSPGKKDLVVVLPEDENFRKIIATAFVLKYPDLDVDGMIELIEESFDSMPVEEIEDVFEDESTRGSSLLKSIDSDFSLVKSISSCGKLVLLSDCVQASEKVESSACKMLPTVINESTDVSTTEVPEDTSLALAETESRSSEMENSGNGIGSTTSDIVVNSTPEKENIPGSSRVEEEILSTQQHSAPPSQAVAQTQDSPVGAQIEESALPTESVCSLDQSEASSKNANSGSDLTPSNLQGLETPTNPPFASTETHKLDSVAGNSVPVLSVLDAENAGDSIMSVDDGLGVLVRKSAEPSVTESIKTQSCGEPPQTVEGGLEDVEEPAPLIPLHAESAIDTKAESTADSVAVTNPEAPQIPDVPSKSNPTPSEQLNEPSVSKESAPLIPLHVEVAIDTEAESTVVDSEAVVKTNTEETQISDASSVSNPTPSEQLNEPSVIKQTAPVMPLLVDGSIDNKPETTVVSDPGALVKNNPEETQAGDASSGCIPSAEIDKPSMSLVNLDTVAAMDVESVGQSECEALQGPQERVPSASIQLSESFGCSERVEELSVAQKPIEPLVEQSVDKVPAALVEQEQEPTMPVDVAPKTDPGDLKAFEAETMISCDPKPVLEPSGVETMDTATCAPEREVCQSDEALTPAVLGREQYESVSEESKPHESVQFAIPEVVVTKSDGKEAEEASEIVQVATPNVAMAKSEDVPGECQRSPVESNEAVPIKPEEVAEEKPHESVQVITQQSKSKEVGETNEPFATPGVPTTKISEEQTANGIQNSAAEVSSMDTGEKETDSSTLHKVVQIALPESSVAQPEKEIAEGSESHESVQVDARDLPTSCQQLQEAATEEVSACQSTEKTEQSGLPKPVPVAKLELSTTVSQVGTEESKSESAQLANLEEPVVAREQDARINEVTKETSDQVESETSESVQLVTPEPSAIKPEEMTIAENEIKLESVQCANLEEPTVCSENLIDENMPQTQKSDPDMNEHLKLKTEIAESKSTSAPLSLPTNSEVSGKFSKFKSTYELMKSMDLGEPKEIYIENNSFNIVNYDKLSFFAERLREIQKDSQIAAITSKMAYVSYCPSDQFVMKSGLLCKLKNLEKTDVFIVLLKSTAVYREIVSALTEQYPDLEFNEFMSLMDSSFIYITPDEIKSLVEVIEQKITSVRYHCFIERCGIVNYDIICNMQEQLKTMQKTDPGILHRYNRLKVNNGVDDSYILKYDLVCQFIGTINFKVCLPKSQPDQIALMYLVHESNHSKGLLEFMELLRATFDGVNIRFIDQAFALCSVCRPPATARASSIIKACELRCPALRSLPPEVIFKIRQVQMASSVYKAQIDLLMKGQSRQGSRYILDTSLLCKAMAAGGKQVYRVVVSPSSLKEVVSLLHTTYHRKALGEFVPFVNEFLAVTETVCKAVFKECYICNASEKKAQKKPDDSQKSPSPKRAHNVCGTSKEKIPEPARETKKSSQVKAGPSLKNEGETVKQDSNKKKSQEHKSVKSPPQKADGKKDSTKGSRKENSSRKDDDKKDSIKEPTKKSFKIPKKESNVHPKESAMDVPKESASNISKGLSMDVSKQPSQKPESSKSKNDKNEKSNVVRDTPVQTLAGRRINGEAHRDLKANIKYWGQPLCERIKLTLRKVPDRLITEVIDLQKSCPELMDSRMALLKSRPKSDPHELICGDILFVIKSKTKPKVAVKPIANIKHFLITKWHEECHSSSVNVLHSDIAVVFDVVPSLEEVAETIKWFCPRCQDPGSLKRKKVYSSLEEELEDFYSKLEEKKSYVPIVSKEGKCDISEQAKKDLEALRNVWGREFADKITAALHQIPHNVREVLIDRQHECAETMDILESLESKDLVKDARHVVCGGILFVVKTQKKKTLVKIHVKPIEKINKCLITELHAAYHDWSVNKLQTLIGAVFDVSPSKEEIEVTIDWLCTKCSKSDATKTGETLDNQLNKFRTTADSSPLEEMSRDHDHDVDLSKEIPATDVRVALAELPNQVVSRIQIIQMESTVLKTQIQLLENADGTAKVKDYCLVMSLLCTLVKLKDKHVWRVMIPENVLEDLVLELHTTYYHNMTRVDFLEFINRFMTVPEDLVDKIFGSCVLCLTTVRHAPTLCELGINEDHLRKSLAMIAEMIDFVMKWQTECPAIASIREGVKLNRQEATAGHILYKDILFKVSHTRGRIRTKIAVSLLPDALDEVIKSTHAFYHSNNPNQLMNLINVCFDLTVTRNLLETKIPQLCKICGKGSGSVQESESVSGLAGEKKESDVGEFCAEGKNVSDEAAETNTGEGATNSGTAETNTREGATNSGTAETNTREGATNSGTAETNTGAGETDPEAGNNDQVEPAIKTEEEPTPLGVLLLGRLCDQVIEESSNSSRALDSPVPETDAKPIVRRTCKILIKRCKYDPSIVQTTAKGAKKRQTAGKKPPAKKPRKQKQEDLPNDSDSESSLPKRKFVVYSSESETEPDAPKRKATGSTPKAKKPRK